MQSIALWFSSQYVLYERHILMIDVYYSFQDENDDEEEIDYYEWTDWISLNQMNS